MTAPEVLRRQAAELRAMARTEADQDLKRQLLELAERCEKLANEMSGSGHADA